MIYYEEIMKVFNETYQAKLELSPLCDKDASKRWKQRAESDRLAVAVTYSGNTPLAFSYANIFKNTAAFGTPGYLPQYAHLNIGEFTTLRLIEGLISLR